MGKNKKEKFEDIFDRYLQYKKTEEIYLNDKYPDNPPVDKCCHAIISGFLINYYPIIKLKSLIPLFETENEKIFIWAHSENRSYALISEVDQNVKRNKYWKNLGNILQLCDASYMFYENILEVKYNWIYYFDHNKSIKESIFYYNDHIMNGTFDGTVKSVEYFKEIVQEIELLVRDDSFYIASNIFLNAVKSHWFCFHCEFQKGDVKDHPSHEPKIWEQAEILPKLEISIVQSCRAVEAILGKPGKRKLEKDEFRTKNKWKSIIDLNPDDIYFKTKNSYFDYYYDLFELRNSSAHSFGKIPFELTRQMAIHAQCFAYIIIDSYFIKNRVPVIEAIKKINLNSKFIDNHSKENTIWTRV